MIRSVYCPSEDRLNEATELADNLKLPIVVGNCSNIAEVEFDRDSVCVISIPDKHFLSVTSDEVRANFSQIIDYTNDFVDLRKGNLSILVDNDPLEFQMLEQHRARCFHRSSLLGEHLITVTIDDTVMAEIVYKVVE